MSKSSKKKQRRTPNLILNEIILLENWAGLFPDTKLAAALSLLKIADGEFINTTLEALKLGKVTIDEVSSSATYVNSMIETSKKKQKLWFMGDVDEDDIEKFIPKLEALRNKQVILIQKNNKLKTIITTYRALLKLIRYNSDLYVGLSQVGKSVNSKWPNQELLMTSKKDTLLSLWESGMGPEFDSNACKAILDGNEQSGLRIAYVTKDKKKSLLDFLDHVHLQRIDIVSDVGGGKATAARLFHLISPKSKKKAKKKSKKKAKPIKKKQRS